MKRSWRAIVAAVVFAGVLSTAQAQSVKWEYLVVSAALKNRGL
ncbi:MAG: hypothetical protein ACKO39_10060 [Chthoniobacterales bacterium]